jgi:hypothetical protein
MSHLGFGSSKIALSSTCCFLSADDGNDGIAKPRSAAELIAKLTTNAAARMILQLKTLYFLPYLKIVLTLPFKDFRQPGQVHEVFQKVEHII